MAYFYLPLFPLTSDTLGQHLLIYYYYHQYQIINQKDENINRNYKSQKL